MLPPAFEFSQGSLQDYVDCRRRFQLRYELDQPWPAVEVEPALEHEVYNVQGRRFHQLLERYYLGVPADALDAGAQDEPLRKWWRAFRAEPPLNLPEEARLPEVRLAVPLAGQWLVAVFDLLAIERGRRLVIVDWKTGRWRPEREIIESRLQTRVYPFVAVEAGARLFGGPVDPARVTMVYWFANHPDRPHVFHYDAMLHEENRAYLSSLIKEIVSAKADGVWPLTADETRCRFCVYRSLCNRGVEAGTQEELEDWNAGDVEAAFDLGEVEEIAF